MASPPLPPASDPNIVSQKRKRSHSPANALPTPPPAKLARTTNASHLHINYLVRQYDEILPLITSDDTLPALLALLADYDGVLQRHESMAGNLGARPLGPMIIKRFERLFDAPPRVLKAHGKEGTQINWLDVVEFARQKPEQFNLEKMRDGVRVCQFYTKQCRVEISEEDFELLRSGVPQKMIPPQPIGEDEEKELGTLEILEKNLSGLVQLADQVSARARQLNHRLKNRKSAIVSRRMAEADARRDGEEVDSPTFRDHQANGYHRPSTSPTGGFTAVNNRSVSNGQGNRPEEYSRTAATTNGNHHGASATTREELLSKFWTSGDRDFPPDGRQGSQSYFTQRPSLPPKSKSRSNYSPTELDYPNNLIAAASQSAVPIPNTPTSLIHQSSSSTRPTAAESREDSGPFKADMMLRMEQLNRADRVQPPCDRCRRLHMDCLKNLTACIGCTKKHAKCSWKEVTERELREFPFVPRLVPETDNNANGSEFEGKDGENSGENGRRRDWSAGAEKSREVRDEELLGEEDSDDEVAGNANAKPTTTKQSLPQSRVPMAPMFPNLPMARGNGHASTEDGPTRAVATAVVVAEGKATADVTTNFAAATGPTVLNTDLTSISLSTSRGAQQKTSSDSYDDRGQNGEVLGGKTWRDSRDAGGSIEEISRPEHSASPMDPSTDVHSSTMGLVSVAGDATASAMKRDAVIVDESEHVIQGSRSSAANVEGESRRGSGEEDERPSSAAGIMRWDEKSGRMRLDG